MEIKNHKWSEKQLLKERKEVLKQWPTGKQIVDLDEAIEYHKCMPEEHNAAFVLTKAKKERKTLIQPRGGVNIVDDHIQLLKTLEIEGGADLLPTTIDSYTRNARFEEAQRAIEKGMMKGNGSILNGLPAVNVGVNEIKKIKEQTNAPLVGRTSAPYPRLLSEILLAGGYTSMEGGGITCLIPYTKTDSLEMSLKRWQYVSRLMRYYYDHGGIKLHRESYGPSTGVLIPPCITLAISILECILDCEQGIAHYSLGYGMGGNLTQDIVAIKVMEEVCREYLEIKGYKNIELTTYFHQYMGAFPKDEERALALIMLGATIGALSNATVIITKSTHEAHGIPTAANNAQGCRITRNIINMLNAEKLEGTDKMKQEEIMLKKATKAILDRIFEIGNGDAAIGTVRAFKAGILDMPFSPSNYNRNLLVSHKDLGGAIRISDPGNVPIPKEVMLYETQKIKERAEIQKIEPGYKMLLEDILAFTGRNY
jgi:methylaspartate mutase epsilon subunit